MTVIVKADGTSEEFRPEKLEQSLKRAGASDELARDILRTVEGELQDHMQTGQLYERAFQLLKQGEHVSAARYAMRRAVLDLGPSGFPFEKFVGEIYRALGYHTSMGITLSGRCVSHEVDMLASKGDETIAAELKFHNQAGFKTDIKVALYVHSRFVDLREAGKQNGADRAVTTPLLITNTKFTENVIAYSQCVGMSLVGWTYPHTGNLQDLIEQTRMYPVTVLTSLTATEKQSLIDKDAGLCSVVAKDAGVLERAGLASDKIEEAYAESRALCGLV